LRQTYRYLTPDLWGKCHYDPTPIELYGGDLKTLGKLKETPAGEKPEGRDRERRRGAPN